MADVRQWASTVVGKYIDVDGAFGGQCWDLCQAWLTLATGATLWTRPARYDGFAAGSWEVINGTSPNGADMRRTLTAIPGDQPGQPGDVVIWDYGTRFYPLSHTAVLIEDRGATLYCLSQNSTPARPDLPGYSPQASGPTVYQSLPREGILGFLRPKTIVTPSGETITPIQEGFLMNLPEADQYEVRDNQRKDIEMGVEMLGDIKTMLGSLTTIIGMLDNIAGALTETRDNARKITNKAVYGIDQSGQ